MRIRGWGWVLPALIGLGGGWSCSSSDKSSRNVGVDGGGYQGGQTGSLSPCSTPAFGANSSVPTGDAALVFHTGCATDADFKITDADGEAVPFELQALDDGVVLVQTDEALTPGSYEVETPDGAQQTVTVTDPAPLPTQLGTLAYVREGCFPLFELTFDDAIAPYLPFLRLEYAVDGGTREVWFEYGTLASQGSAWLEFAIPVAGDHQVEVFGTIAGEDMHPAAATLTFGTTPCTVGEDDNGAAILAICSLGRGGAASGRSSGAVTLVLVAAALALGRRRLQSLTRRR